MDEIFVRGSVNLGNSGLDLALVGNLNELPPKVPMLGTLGIGVLLALLLCAGLRESRERWSAGTRTRSA